MRAPSGQPGDTPDLLPDQTPIMRGSRSSMLELAAHMHARGYNVFLPELRAHGESDGAVSTLGVKEVLDIRAAVRFLQQQPEVDPNQIGIFGESLGSSVALIAAGALPELRAVAADSTFASVHWLVEHQLSALVNLPQWFSGLLLFAGGLEAGIDPGELSPMNAAARLSGAYGKDPVQYVARLDTFFSSSLRVAI